MLLRSGQTKPAYSDKRTGSFSKTPMVPVAYVYTDVHRPSMQYREYKLHVYCTVQCAKLRSDFLSQRLNFLPRLLSNTQHFTSPTFCSGAPSLKRDDCVYLQVGTYCFPPSDTAINLLRIGLWTWAQTFLSYSTVLLMPIPFIRWNVFLKLILRFFNSLNRTIFYQAFVIWRNLLWSFGPLSGNMWKTWNRYLKSLQAKLQSIRCHSTTKRTLVIVWDNILVVHPNDYWISILAERFYGDIEKIREKNGVLWAQDNDGLYYY